MSLLPEKLLVNSEDLFYYTRTQRFASTMHNRWFSDASMMGLTPSSYRL